MTSKSRLLVLLVSTPIIVLVVVGGLLGRTLTREDAYQPLRIFDEVVSLILNNYVEQVAGDKIMRGAMLGLAEGLDADSAWLTPEQANIAAKGGPQGRASVGLALTRQYYLRVIAARDGSPAARAGLRTGDFIRAIDKMPTRDVSVWGGQQLLRGAPGTKVSLTILRGSTTEPHIIELTREELAAAPVTGRIAKPGIGLVRIAAFTDHTAAELKQEVAALRKEGATSLVIDLRRTADGAPALGVAPARLFVSTGTLSATEGRAVPKQTQSAAAGDGDVTLPVALLVDNGTSLAAEVFAAALAGNKRATLVGEHTLGRAAAQELVRLPDGSGLWMTTSRFLRPDGTAIHEKGLAPDIAVAEPDVEFGSEPPTTDPILDKAIEQLSTPAKAAA